MVARLFNRRGLSLRGALATLAIDLVALGCLAALPKRADLLSVLLVLPVIVSLAFEAGSMAVWIVLLLAGRDARRDFVRRLAAKGMGAPAPDPMWDPWADA